MFDPKEQAKNEILNSLKISTFGMRCYGVHFQKPKTNFQYYLQIFIFVSSIVSVVYHLVSEIVYVGIVIVESGKLEDVVIILHTFGYALLSVVKAIALWYKKDTFRQLLHELVDIWPDTSQGDDVKEMKEKNLAVLQVMQKGYFILNLIGLWFYNLTPLAIYLYHLWQGDDDAQLGFIWKILYPFDKKKPIAHFLVYLFEVFIGQVCVWIMTSTDLLFSAMSSHVSMLLRLLKRQLESFASTELTQDDYYNNIVNIIKLHQRLVKYCNDLEEAFTVVNLVNIVLSSLNICCVLFVIVLLDPFLAMNNKIFLGSALIQIGILCWYADEIYWANADIASAAYNNRWFRASPRCRRCILFLITRSQKPIAFTAMKFTTISLATYSSILTRSYSYFALLYTLYKK